MRAVLSLLLLLVSPGAVVFASDAKPGGKVPVAVSPGDVSVLASIADTCPTFSWGEVEGARSYELVVYRLAEDGLDAREAPPVLRKSFPGTVESWTPSLGSCFEPGGRYAWSVRAEPTEEADGADAWSAPALFEISLRPSEAELARALEVVRRYVELGGSQIPGGLSGDPSQRDGYPAEAPAASEKVLPLTLPASAGDPALQVNGQPVVTAATFRTALCEASEIRFLDQGDGTVLDCATGLVWLKQPDCLPRGTWDGSPPHDAGSVQAILAAFNVGGTSCVDYPAGQYSDWRMPTMAEMCGLWNGSCTGSACCDPDAGLVNADFLGPAVVNARDDGQWADDDAFATGFWGLYFSSNEDGALDVWATDFGFATATTRAKTEDNGVFPVRDP